MSDETPERNERTFQSLANLLETGTSVSTLATAIEKEGIHGWDRFGRFTTYKKDSTGHDAVTYANVLDCLAAQYAWECNLDNDQAHTQSPLEMVDYSGPFEFGWFNDKAPDFSAIVAGTAGQKVAPTKQASKRAETTDLNIIAVMLEFLMPKAGYTADATLIGELLDKGYGDYDGISQRTLQQRFALAKKRLNQ